MELWLGCRVLLHGITFLLHGIALLHGTTFLHRITWLIGIGDRGDTGSNLISACFPC